MFYNVDRIKTSILITGFLFIAGCGSIFNRIGLEESKHNNQLYPGIKEDVDEIKSIGKDLSSNLLWIPIYVIDMPLSLIMDTVLLPYDLIRKSKH